MNMYVSASVSIVIIVMKVIIIFNITIIYLCRRHNNSVCCRGVHLLRTDRPYFLLLMLFYFTCGTDVGHEYY